MTFVSVKDQIKLLKNVINDIDDNETFFYWHYVSKNVNFGTNDDMKIEMKIWKQMKKLDKLIMRECNNKSFEIEGTEYHILVLQDTDDECNPIDPLALGVHFHVCGLVYFFRSKKNRDTVYNYVMIPKSRV